MSLKGKVVVTGVSSFIGCHIASYLSQQQYEVVGTISAEESSYSGIRRERLRAASAADVRLERLDLTNTDELLRFVETEQPDVWVQHAGYVLDYDSWNYDLTAGHHINVMPLETLYKALSGVHCKGVVITGTQSEYGDTANASGEEDACWPNTAYGLSKLTGTVRARQLAQQYAIRTRVARIFIPFGVLDSPKKLMPSVVRSLAAGLPVELTACEQQRDYCSIDDLVSGYGALIRHLDDELLFEVFNLCSGNPLSLKQLLLEMADTLQADRQLLQFGKLPMRPGEAAVCYGSNEKARQLLGWKPQPLRSSLKRYIDQMTKDEVI